MLACAARIAACNVGVVDFHAAFIELCGVVAQSRIAALLNVREDAAHD
jgi:hypothetical protein